MPLAEPGEKFDQFFNTGTGQFWDEENYINLDDYDIEFATQVVTIKYFDQYDPFTQAQNDIDNFDIVNEPRDDKYGQTNIRVGHGDFKGKILKAYNNQCCITGEIIPELLEAAHIQEYRNRNSNHVQNGLLLRVDIHRLYDNGLVFIDHNYLIHVSNLVHNPYYRQYHEQTIQLPSSVNDHPSVEALEQRRDEFRNL